MNTTASFGDAYNKVVEGLRELRDKHNQDPVAVARHVALQLSKERSSAPQQALHHASTYTYRR